MTDEVLLPPDPDADEPEGDDDELDETVDAASVSEDDEESGEDAADAPIPADGR